MQASIKRFFTSGSKKQRDNRWIFGSMLVGSLLALLASFVLSTEALQLASNPNAVFSCSVNLVLNCSTVAKDASSHVFGFPNSFVGMMTLPVMVTIAVAGLAGVKFPRWFMRAAMAGSVLGVLFAAWMFYVSYFVIQALCPWCLLTDVSMLLVLFAVFRYNVRENNLCVRGKWVDYAKNCINKNYDKLALAIVVVAIAAAILLKYGSALFV